MKTPVSSSSYSMSPRVAPPVRLDQIVVGKRRLRILVQVLHVGMGGRAVEVEVVFFNVFAVVGLAVRQAEHDVL